MKKVFSLILALMLCFTICACGNAPLTNSPYGSAQSTPDPYSAMKAELKNGSWVRVFSPMPGMTISQIYTFKNESKVEVIEGSGTTSYGTYEVNDTLVTITFDDGNIRELSYTFEDNNLELSIAGASGADWTLHHDC